MTPIDIEAQCRSIRARIEGQMWPQLWMPDLLELARLERILSDMYAAQRTAGWHRSNGRDPFIVYVDPTGWYWQSTASDPAGPFDTANLAYDDAVSCRE